MSHKRIRNRHQPQGGPSMQESALQMEHNRVLTKLRGKPISRIAFVTLEGGSLPDGTRYDGDGLIIETGGNTCDEQIRMLVIPRENGLNFFLISHEDCCCEENPATTAMHACDYIEAEAVRNKSDCSRFTGQRSTVYVAVSERHREAFNRLYETLAIEDATIQ